MNTNSTLLHVVTVCTVILVGGCTNVDDVDSAKNGTHLVQLYSGGKMVRQWHATDVPTRKNWSSDSWHFTNSETDRLVRVTGSIVITTLK